MSSSNCRRMVSLCLSDACSSRASRLPRWATSLFSRVAGARRPIDRLKPHQAHQPTGPASADPHALAAQVKRHPTGAVKRVLQEELVDAAHQRERLRALPLRLVVERGAPDRQQAALPAQAQRRVVAHNHRAALRAAHRPGPRDKKSRSTISSPILA